MKLRIGLGLSTVHRGRTGRALDWAVGNCCLATGGWALPSRDWNSFGSCFGFGVPHVLLFIPERIYHVRTRHSAPPFVPVCHPIPGLGALLWTTVRFMRTLWSYCGPWSCCARLFTCAKRDSGRMAVGAGAPMGKQRTFVFVGVRGERERVQGVAHSDAIHPTISELFGCSRWGSWDGKQS